MGYVEYTPQRSGTLSGDRSDRTPRSGAQEPKWQLLPPTGIGTDIPKGFGTGIGQGGYITVDIPAIIDAVNTGNQTGGTPDKNGYVWTLPNGQAFPPTRIILISNRRRTYYYEDKNLSTRFQVIGKTIEECSRAEGVQVGEFTGNYVFNDQDPFGKGYTLRSLEVKTKFPFDRLGNPVDTEYTLWIDTFVKYVADNGQGGYDFNEPGNGSNSGGYTTGDGDKPGDAAKKNRNAFLIIGGLVLLATSRKRKRK